jgi:hypothetical protein
MGATLLNNMLISALWHLMATVSYADLITDTGHSQAIAVVIEGVKIGSGSDCQQSQGADVVTRVPVIDSMQLAHLFAVARRACEAFMLIAPCSGKGWFRCYCVAM